MRMHILLLGIILGFLAQVQSNPVPGAITEVPAFADVDVLQEAMTEEGSAVEGSAVEGSGGEGSAVEGSGGEGSAVEGSAEHSTSGQEEEEEELYNAKVKLTLYPGNSSDSTLSTPSHSSALSPTPVPEDVEDLFMEESTETPTAAYEWESEEDTHWVGENPFETYFDTRPSPHSNHTPDPTTGLEKGEGLFDLLSQMMLSFLPGGLNPKASPSPSLDYGEEKSYGEELFALSPDSSFSTTSSITFSSSSSSSTTSSTPSTSSSSSTPSPMSESEDGEELFALSPDSSFSTTSTTSPSLSLSSAHTPSSTSMTGIEEGGSAQPHTEQSTTELASTADTSSDTDTPLGIFIGMEGSGSGFLSERPEEENTPTVAPPTWEKRTLVGLERIHHSGLNVGAPLASADESIPAEQHGYSTPGWMIILAFVVGVAALVLLCIAIATRDRWNGPKQTSEKKQEEAKGSSSDQQEQEMETFLHNERPKENGHAEEYTVITLEELPVKEPLD